MAEHLMFAGTPAFPEEAWWRDLVALGGDANAATSWDATTYTTRVVPEGLDMVLRMEAARFASMELAWGAELRAADIVARGSLGLPQDHDPAEALETLDPEALEAALQRILDPEGVRLHVR